MFKKYFNFNDIDKKRLFIIEDSPENIITGKSLNINTI